MKLILLLVSLLFASNDLGIKLGVAVPDHTRSGFNAGIFGLIDVGSGFFRLYPSIDVWYSHESYDSYYLDRYWQDNYEHHVLETNINVDGVFVFRSHSVSPYLGLGLCPTATNWEEDYDVYDPSYVDDHYRYMHGDNDIGVGFNLFCGMIFPMGSANGLLEARGKFGDYDVFKLQFGVIF